MSEKKQGELVELCGLWRLPSGKGFSGSLGGARVLVLENTNKRGEKSPDFRIFMARNEKRDAPKTNAEQPASNDDRDDDKIPF